MPESEFTLTSTETYEPRIHRQFILAIEAMRNKIPLLELTELLEQGRIEDIFNQISPEFVRIEDIVLAAYLAAGAETAAFISEFIDSFIAFDQLNDRAIAQMRSDSQRLIQRFNAQQRAASQLALQDGLRRGLTPVDQAKNFILSLGLSEKQQAALINYRRLLERNSAQALRLSARDKRFDASLRRAIQRGTALSAAQIDKMIGRYYLRLLNQRGAVIGRTESLGATNSGSDEMWTQSYDDFKVMPAQVENTWLTSRDELVRGTHAPMHQQKRAPGRSFTSGAGVSLRFPGDPSAPANETVNCRCRKKTRIFRE